MMIHEYSLGLLQKAIQKALALDPHISQKMRPLRGKTIQIIINPLRIHFYMIFEESSVKLEKCCTTTPNTIIHSTPLGLIRLSLLPASEVRSLFNNQIKITGDTLVGQQVKHLFDSLTIDWEGHLAQFTGDVIAYQVGSLARFGASIKTQLKTSFNHQVTEYIQEEARLSPAREELEDFMNDIDELSLKVARLEARLNYYLAEHEKNNTDSSTTKN
jgi:ubiquinone biosynthesis accessory factor UbiJ